VLQSNVAIFLWNVFVYPTKMAAMMEEEARISLGVCVAKMLNNDPKIMVNKGMTAPRAIAAILCYSFS
jgi:hypothetical protein